MALSLHVLLFLLLVPVVRRGQSDAARQAGGGELAALLSAALCGAAVTLSLEALTLFQAIRAETVTFFWLLLDVAVAAWLFGRLRWNPWRGGPGGRPRPARGEGGFPPPFCLPLPPPPSL